jgi:hypothetical protein
MGFFLKIKQQERRSALIIIEIILRNFLSNEVNGKIILCQKERDSEMFFSISARAS